MESKYIVDNCYHEAVLKLKEYIEKYANEEHLEVEFRLGYLENDEFKTDIGKEFFDKISDKLEDSESWSSIVHENSEDYFYNGRRLSILAKELGGKESKDADKGVCIKKIKLAVLDFMIGGSGFDLRISFSKEVPSIRFAKDKANYKRVKERTSYNFKHLSFDLTKVTMEENTIEDHLFEIELEAKTLDLTKMTSHYFVHDALLKITDLVKMCEEVDDNSSISFVKEKIYT